MNYADREKCLWRSFVNQRIDQAEQEQEHRAMFTRIMNKQLERQSIDGMDDMLDYSEGL